MQQECSSFDFLFLLGLVSQCRVDGLCLGAHVGMNVVNVSNVML